MGVNDWHAIVHRQRQVAWYYDGGQQYKNAGSTAGAWSMDQGAVSRVQ